MQEVLKPFVNQMALKATEETIYVDSGLHYIGLKSSSLTPNGSNIDNNNNDGSYLNDSKMISLSELPKWFEVTLKHIHCHNKKNF